MVAMAGSRSIAAGASVRLEVAVRAMLVARTTPLEGGAKGYTLSTTHVNGVIIRCEI